MEFNDCVREVCSTVINRPSARHRAGTTRFHTAGAGRAVAGISLTLGAVVAGVSVTGGGQIAHADPAPATTAEDPASSPVDTSALPADADGLLERLDEVSRQAEATSDRVVENAAALEEARALSDRAREVVDRYTAEADAAAARAKEAQGPVTDLSRSLYRGATVDPVTATVGASSPQDAIDRRAYSSALSASRTAKVTELEESLRSAASSRSLALRTKATADFRLAEAARQQRELDARTAELDTLKDQIATAVNNMSPDQKQRWIDRNGPIQVDVPQILESVEASPVSDGVVAAALSKLGAPYSWGAAGPDAFDCSGLMYWAYQQIGKTIPRTSGAQISGGTPVSRDQLQPGDIVGYYSGVSHVGMYIGDGQIVHASDYGIPVQVVSVDSMPFAGAARY